MCCFISSPSVSEGEFLSSLFVCHPVVLFVILVFLPFNIAKHMAWPYGTGCTFRSLSDAMLSGSCLVSTPTISNTYQLTLRLINYWCVQLDLAWSMCINGDYWRGIVTACTPRYCNTAAILLIIPEWEISDS